MTGEMPGQTDLHLVQPGRCLAPDREHLVDAQQIQHPGYGSSSVTLPARVLAFMAVITSVLIDAESA
jgi:hypothetical protein